MLAIFGDPSDVFSSRLLLVTGALRNVFVLFDLVHVPICVLKWSIEDRWITTPQRRRGKRRMSRPDTLEW